MAQTNYINSENINYCGKEANEIFAKDVFTLDIKNVGVSFLNGVKGKRKIYMGTMDNAYQLYSCPFTPDGGVSLSEAYIEPVALKVNKEFCRNEFFDTFMTEQLEFSLNGKLPQSFTEWYFVKLREEMAREYQEIAFQGDVNYSGIASKNYLKATDGWEKRLSDNANTTHITGSVFTVDNILAQVEATIQAGLASAATMELPTDKFKVLMNKHDVALLKMALGKICCPNNDSIFSNYAKGPDGGVIIYGFEVIPTEVSRNTIIFGDPRNLILGFDVWDSHVSYKIIDMKDTTLDDMYRVGAITNIAIGIVFPETFTISKP